MYITFMGQGSICLFISIYSLFLILDIRRISIIYDVYRFFVSEILFVLSLIDLFMW